MDRPSQISPATDIDIEQGGPSESSVNTKYRPLLKAVQSGDLDATEKLLRDNPEAVNARITSHGETALHIATLFGQFNIVEKLVQLMSKKDLELKDKDGITALHVAATNRNENNIKAVKCMVGKNKGLLAITDVNEYIPLTIALDFGHTEMARYLYSVTPFEVLTENGKNGALLLTLCYYYKMFDIALDLIRHCPRLVVIEGRRGLNFFETLAALPYAFVTETQLPFWKRWLHKWLGVGQEPAFAINEEVIINIPTTTSDERREDHDMRGTSRGLLHQLVRSILHSLGIEKIHEAKLAQKQCEELVHAACNVIPTLNEEDISRIRSAILVAAQRGNPEFIVEAVKEHLPLVWTSTEDRRRLFFLAVQFRQEKVFNLIHGFVLKHVFANLRDKYGNCLLHMAALLAPSTSLDHISGALLQMQRELQWYKEVESIMPPTKKEYRNLWHYTPRELFRVEHKELVKQGEEWTKGIASSCSVVAVLVATITFAAVFTVPGGNDQEKGYPILLHKKLFMLFAIPNAVSLFSSSTSLLMFLGLLTSRYAEDDFLKSLPTKLIIGLSTMFISIATMVVAFCAALFLMLQNQPWIVVPVAVLACVPVTLYIWLQFPLLVEIFMSTYGPGIFNRNVKPWP